MSALLPLANLRRTLSPVALALALPFAGAQLVAAERLDFPTPSKASWPINFELDVLPILTASGCNSGACHGKSKGQNGFQLSLLGFDVDNDYASIVEQARG